MNAVANYFRNECLDPHKTKWVLSWYSRDSNGKLIHRRGTRIKAEYLNNRRRPIHVAIK